MTSNLLQTGKQWKDKAPLQFNPKKPSKIDDYPKIYLILKQYLMKLEKYGLIKDVLPRLLNTIGMKNYNLDNFEIDSFWENLLKFRDKKYPVPEMTTLYYARKKLGVIDNTVKKLSQTTAGERPLIRTSGEGKGTRYALPDIMIFSQFRD